MTVIKFEEIKTGESQLKSHPGKTGWLEIQDFSWDIESETSFLKGAGASVGKATPGNLSITHHFDMSSPTIMTKIVEGTFFKNVWLLSLKQTGKPEGEVFFGIHMANVFMTKVSTKGGEDGSVSQDVEMVFKTCSIGYKPQTEAGGGLGTQIDFMWDIGQMSTAGLTVANLGTT
jgi:type VI secretion system secreted protein Hcp